MGYAVSLALLLIASTLHYCRKTWVHPDTLFCYEWGIISLLSSLHLFSMYATSDKTWCIIFVGAISFCIGTTFGSRMKLAGTIQLQEGYLQRTPFFSDKLFWIIVFVSLLISVPDFIQSVKLMMRGVSLGAIREASYGIINLQDYNYKSGAFYQIFTLIKNILRYTVVAVAIESFVYDMRKGAKKLIIVGFTEVMISFTSGGRFAVAYLIVELMTCFGLYKRYGASVEYHISTKTKRWIKRLVVLLLGLIVVLTFIRGANVSDLVVKYYRYICGNIKFFDLHVEQLKESGFWSLGYAGLYGFWSTILPFFNMLGIAYPLRYLDTIQQVMNTQTFLSIGNRMSTNAFITPFYYLYADFRFIGVILGMFIFGVFAGIVFKKVTISMQPSYIVFYLVVAQMIFKTLQVFPLVSDAYFFGIFFMAIIIKMGKKRLHS